MNLGNNLMIKFFFVIIHISYFKNRVCKILIKLAVPFSSIPPRTRKSKANQVCEISPNSKSMSQYVTNPINFLCHYYFYTLAIYIMAINSGFFPARGPEGLVFLARAPARAQKNKARRSTEGKKSELQPCYTIFFLP